MASHGITLQTVRGLALNSIAWDGVIPGFGVRRRVTTRAPSRAARCKLCRGTGNG
jgi:hypothetical protein